MSQRIWVDTLIINTLPHRDMEKLFHLGYTFVMSTSALDVTYFQNNPAWVEEKIKEGKLIIEHWIDYPEKMFQKEFLWTSLNTISQAGEAHHCLSKLPKSQKLLKLYEVILEYGIPSDQWFPVQTAQIPTDFPSRTDALVEYKTTNHMNLFNNFNKSYVRELAIQHNCQFILSRGAIVMV